MQSERPLTTLASQFVMHTAFCMTSDEVALLLLLEGNFLWVSGGILGGLWCAICLKLLVDSGLRLGLKARGGIRFVFVM